MSLGEHPPCALRTIEGDAEASKMNAMRKRTIVETLRDLMIAK
jgi:hypothetical protein